MRNRIDPMVFAAVYSFVMPLALGVFALWLPLKTSGVETLYRWQTLVAGLIAVAAALVGGAFVFNQTRESRRQHDTLLARRHAAARSVLPLALSRLVDYAEEAAHALEALRSTAVGQRVRGHAGVPFTVPSFESVSIERLRDTIESASDEVGDRISRVISDVQVLDSRLRGFPSKLLPGSSSIIAVHNIDDYILNAATIYARCFELFAYARRETDAAPSTFPSAGSLCAALRLLGFDELTHDNIFAMAAVRAERHASAA